MVDPHGSEGYLKMVVEIDQDHCQIQVQEQVNHKSMITTTYSEEKFKSRAKDKDEAIRMLEKTYPLTKEMLSRMLSGKLEVDNESEMAFKLLRFTRSQIKK
ncbi:hypothetical protein Tco_1555428 [Tanacetum coccineum]